MTNMHTIAYWYDTNINYNMQVGKIPWKYINFLIIIIIIMYNYLLNMIHMWVICTAYNMIMYNR